MSKNIQAVRGMNDLLPDALPLWQKLEQTIRELTHAYAYQEIRTPIVEPTALFKRSIGEVTDIVEKEMYTFADRNGDSLSLRPEGTAATVRAGQQHGLLYNQEQRLWYMGPMFRHERPQKGRYRQFFQFGVEFYGVPSADADAEILIFSAHLWEKLGLSQDVRLELNTIGNQDEREAYKVALRAYLLQHKTQLDEDSQRRLDTNVLRILDSKSPQTQALLSDAPTIEAFLGEASRSHFERLCALLDHAGVAYTVNPRLVRGLDYYSSTVFEWVTDALGSQGAVLAGGRYDNLVSELGGKPTPAVGFAAGMERLVLLLEQRPFGQSVQQHPDLYVVALGLEAEQASFAWMKTLRDQQPQWRVLQNCGGGNMKKQMKRADRSQAKLAVIVGDNEVQAQQVLVKCLRGTGTQEQVPVADLVNYLRERLL